MNYPIVIHKDSNSDFGVTVPDLPGCFSAGSTIDEAMTMAKEALELYIEVLAEDGREIPEASPIQTLQSNPDHAGGIWAVVSVDYRQKGPISAAS